MRLGTIVSILLTLAVATASGFAQDVVVATEQTTCPVMEGNAIDRSLFTEYKGKRVYFCCNVCKGAFEKEPEKYLGKLPQFTDSVGNAHGKATHHDQASPAQTAGLRLYRFTAPLGITTFTLLVLTLTTGLSRRKLKKHFLRIHRPLAVTTAVAAALHALTVLLGH